MYLLSSMSRFILSISFNLLTFIVLSLRVFINSFFISLELSSTSIHLGILTSISITGNSPSASFSTFNISSSLKDKH